MIANLSSPAAKATAKSDGAKNRSVLEAAGLVGKKWPIRMPTVAAGDAPLKPNEKIIHFIRHGQGFHNSLADYHRLYKLPEFATVNPYNINENFDPPLTELGRQQARALQPTAK